MATKKAGGGVGAASKLIDGRIAEVGGWRGETLARVRRLMKQAVPGVVEEWKWAVPVWSDHGIICTGETYKAAVKLTFAKGAALKDPAKLFTSSLGYRMSHKTGHWVLSNELRFAACQNWQMSREGDFSGFVPVGDIRLEAAYEFTREVAIRVGWQMLYYGDGVRRGDPSITANDQIITTTQDMLMTGVTFGFTINR